MKFKLLLASILISINVSAQITISQEDLPEVDNTYFLNNANPVNSYDFTLTGENYNWDFSELETVNQNSQSFIPVSSAPFTYQFFFNSPFDPDHQASFATAQDGFALSEQFTFEDFFAFYKKSETAYSIVGNAGTINGIPLPAPSDPVDVIYDLPLDFQATGSNYSEWQIQIPGILTYKLKQTRNYEVDGWGTITTPLGSFEALRVKMEIDAIDSIALEVLSFDFENERNSIEYQWLGIEMGMPILVATESMGFITSIVFQGEEIVNLNEISSPGISVYPNPSNGMIQIDGELKGSMLLYNSHGQLIETWNTIQANKRIDLSHLENGIYIIENPESGLSSRIIVNH